MLRVPGAVGSVMGSLVADLDRRHNQQESRIRFLVMHVWACCAVPCLAAGGDADRIKVPPLVDPGCDSMPWIGLSTVIMCTPQYQSSNPGLSAVCSWEMELVERFGPSAVATAFQEYGTCPPWIVGPKPDLQRILYALYDENELHVGADPEEYYFDNLDEVATYLSIRAGIDAGPESYTVYLHRSESPYLIAQDFSSLGGHVAELRFIAVDGDQDNWQESTEPVVIQPGSGTPLSFDGEMGVYLQGIELTGFPGDQTDTHMGSALSAQCSSLELQNCVLHHNGQGGESTNNDGVAAALFFEPTAAPGLLTVENCLFHDNHSIDASPAAMVVRDNTAQQVPADFRIVNSTFHRNTPQPLESTGAERLQLELPSGVNGGGQFSGGYLRNCLFTGLPEDFDPEVSPAYIDFTGSGVPVFDHCLFDSRAWAESEIPAGNHVIVSSETEVGYVSVVDAFTLRHDSPALDKGLPLMSDLDFDLTARDIGFSRQYPVEQLVSMAPPVSSIGPGWFEASAGYFQIEGPSVTIQPGTIIRVNNNGFMNIKCQSGGQIVVGAPGAERVALVGASTLDAAPGSSARATCFNFEGTGTAESNQLVIHGLLCNVGANMGTRFNVLSMDLHGSRFHEGYNSLFLNFGGSYVTAYQCLGSVNDHDFHGQVESIEYPPSVHPYPGLKQFQIHYSGLDLLGCTFGRSTPMSSFALSVYGSSVGENPLMANCVYDGSAEIPTTTAAMKVEQSGMLLSGNQFQNCLNPAIRGVTGSYLFAGYSMQDDRRAGRNVFTKRAGRTSFDYTIRLFGTAGMSAECGLNAFLDNRADQFDFIGYISSDQTQATSSMSHNFWSWGPAETGFTDLTGWVPQWMDTDPELTTMPTPGMDPCALEEPLDLYKQGTAAAMAHNYSGALALWMQLLGAHTSSEYAGLAAAAIKSLGLNGSWALEYGVDVRDALLDAADIAVVKENFDLAVQELSHAWTVEARHGDRVTALLELDQMTGIWEDPAYLQVIYTAIAEVESFPPQGGLSSANPDAMRARVLAQQSFFDFLDGQQAAPSLEESLLALLPGGFELQAAYPNPFNPSTRIPLLLSEQQDMSVEVYNLQGQRVATLHRGPLDAGRHVLEFRGDDLAAGVYFIHANGPRHDQTRKVLLLK